MSQQNIQELEELMGRPVDSTTTIVSSSLTALFLLAFVPVAIQGLLAMPIPLGRTNAVIAGIYIGVILLTVVFIAIAYLGIRERLGR